MVGDLHKILLEHKAKIYHTDSGIKIYLPSDGVDILLEDGHICLIIKASKEEAKQIDEECSAKILNAALEALYEHEYGLTPAELQYEIAQRGVIASTSTINHVLAKSDKVIRIGKKWYLKYSLRKKSFNGWKLVTNRVCYRAEGEEIVIGFIKSIKDGVVEPIKRIPCKLLEDIYKILPDRATYDDIAAIASALGIEKIYLMHIIANEFGGELYNIGPRDIIYFKPCSEVI